MKNRTRENCTSGSVRDEDGNILIYSALIGGTMETAASFEARNAPSSYPTMIVPQDIKPKQTVRRDFDNV